MSSLIEPLRYFDAYTCIGQRQKVHPAAPYTLEHLLAEMDHCSIDGALVTSTACLRYDPMRENRRLVEQIAGHAGLFALWHVFPHWTGECPEPAALFKAMQQQGAARAVLLAPATASWDPLSRTSRPLMEALAGEAVPAVVDVAKEMPLEQVEQLAERYPKLPIVLRNVHWGKQRHVLPLMLHFENLHLTFDALQINFGLEWLVEQGCGERLLYCSNATDMAMGAHRFYVDYADVDAQMRAAIAGGNLTRLLQGQAPAQQRENADEDPIMAEARRGEPLSVPVIDAHAHILDEGLDGAGGAYTMFRGGPKHTHDLARRMGVDAIGVMSWNGIMVPEPEDGNRCVRAALDAYPDFFWGLGTFDPVHDDAATFRRKAEALFEDPRFLGLKPYPLFGLHYDHPNYAPWWE
ncbi:MAG: hypothetical protein ACODAQ_08765, partial [Phycisphaeraceae bacterium]